MDKGMPVTHTPNGEVIMLKTKKDRQLRPIPEAITDAIDWIDVEGKLSPRELEKAMKKAIRGAINSGKVNWDEFGWCETYDARIWEMIESVLSEN